MQISESFSTLQGEGRNIGKPAYFIRVGMCSLSCHFCDTFYTWDFQTHPEYLKDIKKKKIIEVVDEIKSQEIKRVVWTGGEPIAQQKEIYEVIESLGFPYIHEVETSGVVSITYPELFETITVSPKDLVEQKYKNKVNTKWEELNIQPNVIFKFVVEDKEQYEQIKRLIQEKEIKRPIYMMPEGTNIDRLNEVGRWLAELCKQDGFNFTTRLHILLWGNQRGR